MVSTSSSECDCTGPFHFSTTVPNNIANAFYSTTRQPLIYYAKVEDQFVQQPHRRNKKNTNYFMKAFRWYTQEHGSGQDTEISSSKASKIKNGDFAAWLDRKYSEYLRGSQQEKSNITFKESRKKSMKRFGRMHSPWRKSRQNSKEEGDISYNIQSFEYIMPPKDLNKIESECCQRMSRLQSITTIASKPSRKVIDVNLRAQSILSTCKDHGRCVNNDTGIDSYPKNILCECVKKDIGTQYETLSLDTLNTPRKKRNLGPAEIEAITKRYSPQKYREPNCSCQCSEVNLNEADVDSSLGRPHPQIDEYVSDKHETVIKKETLTMQGDSSRLPKTVVLFTDNTNNNVPKLQNFSAQTSDRAINLENIVLKQPVLVKIMNMSGER